jgi:DNA-binding NtrC family response regulator
MRNSKQPIHPPITVFVVDDEPMLLELASAILQPEGFEVRTFRDPRTALQEFKKSPPNIVVTDYAMGPMNGMEVVRECRNIHPEQKIILLSGTVDESIYFNEPERPDCFLAKPYQIQKFIEMIKNLAGIPA